MKGQGNMSSTNNDFVFGRHAGIDFLKTQDSEKINKVFLAEGVQEDFRPVTPSNDAE